MLVKKHCFGIGAWCRIKQEFSLWSWILLHWQSLSHFGDLFWNLCLFSFVLKSAVVTVVTHNTAAACKLAHKHLKLFKTINWRNRHTFAHNKYVHLELVKRHLSLNSKLFWNHCVGCVCSSVRHFWDANLSK